MFDVWNSTFSVDNLQLYADTPDTAVSLIRSSTFVVSRCEITSCPETSPFVIGHSGMESSGSVSIISCSHRSPSESSSLLPLVSGLTSFPPSASDSSTGGHDADTFGVGSLSIVGTGLIVKSQHLVAGTGPLFDFGIPAENGLFGVVGCSVSLLGSSLTNTTSTRLSSSVSPSCTLLKQRVIGVSVSESTNHLCGTSGMELNWAGSSLLSNSSFSSCFTNDTPDPVAEPTQDPSKLYESYISKKTRIYLEKDKDETLSNPIWVADCEFSDLNATDDGAAIYVSQYNGDFVLKDTSIKNCHGTKRSTFAVVSVRRNFEREPKNRFSATIFNCHFSNNSADASGHLHNQYSNPVTIAQCTFEDSRLPSSSPLKLTLPIHINHQGEFRFDNSTISNNEGYEAGGIGTSQKDPADLLVLTSILFQDNVCTYKTENLRVFDLIIYGGIKSATVQFIDCFSTSAQPHCGILNATQLYPDFVGPSITSVVQTIRETGNGDELEVTLSFEGVFTGTSRKYDVTLEDAGGNQLVTENVSFSTTAGEVTFALNNPNVPSLSFSTNYTIVKVERSASEATSNELVFEGDTEPDWTWWHHTADSRAGKMVSLSFITPPEKPARISSALASLSGTNMTWVDVALTGEELPCGKDFTIVVKEMEGDAIKSGATGISLTGHIEGSSGTTETTCKASVEIYNQSNTLEYSKTYKIISLDVEGQAGIVGSAAKFTVDASPCRVEGTEAPTLNGMKTTVSVKVKGVNFPSTVTSMKVKGESTPIISTSITDISATELTVAFGTGKEETLELVQFGETYEIVEISGGSTVYVNSGVGFAVPVPGTVSSTSTQLNSTTNEHFKVIVNGMNFVSGSEWTMKLNGRSEEISVTMTSAEQGESSWVKAGGSGQIEFGQSYTLSTMTQKSKPSEHLVCAGVSLATPPGPALTNIKAEPNPLNLNEAEVSVTVSPRAAGDFTLIVLDAQNAEISIGPFLFTSSSTATTSSHTVLIHPSGKLSYGKTYTVKMLSSSTLIVSHSGQTVKMPDAPPRISLAAAALSGENETWVTLTLTGEALPCGKDFTIVVKEMEGEAIKSGAPEITLTGTIEGSSGTTTTCTASVEIYNQSNTLEYSKKYKVESLKIVGYGCIVDSTVNFTVDDSPCRVEGTEAPTLNGMKTTVSVKVKGVNFPSTVTSMKVKGESTPIISTSITDISATELTVTFDTNSEGSGTALGFEKSYSIVEISGGSTVYVNSGVGFTVPSPPTLTAAHFSFATKSNTTFHLILEGTLLPVSEKYLVSLQNIDNPIEVTFTTPTEGSSAELALGWSDTLQFGTDYPLVSVILKGMPSILIPSTHLTLQTDSRPNPLILYATDSGNSDPKFCGAEERPCSSVDVAKNLVVGIAAQHATIKIITKAAINNPISVETGHELKLELATLTPPTLVIPSTASLGASTSLISVAGTLLVESVEIEVQIDALSFVLFDVEGGMLVMDSVHISGVPSSSEVVDGIEGLCSWETGLIKLHDTTAKFENCRMSSIGMGEIWMESSSLSLISTQILSCGAQFSLFPSAQQDVMCKSGNITILPSSSDTSKDHWISSTSECSVVLNRSELKSPHFVPSLDEQNCQSTLSKKKDSFSVLIVGSKLIPCDLKLEVSESSSSKSNIEPVSLPLSFSSAESWNETHLNLSIPSSNLSSLSSDQKWTACIVYGMGEHTESFTFLESLKQRKAEALKQSLRWLVPVILCSVLLLLAVFIVVVVVVCRRRRKTRSASSTLLSQQELSEEVVDKMDVELAYPTTNGVIAQNSHEAQTAMASDESGDTRAEYSPHDAPQLDDPVEALLCEGQFPMETVDGHDTLYDRIHKGEGVAEGKKREIERKIVRGMIKMVEKRNLESGTRISPHWILLNRNDSVFIRVESDIEKKQEQDKPSLPNTTQPSVSQTRAKNGIEEIRWRAPEQGEKEGEMKGGVEASKVMVFRLGLIVWEIETGLVPFGELDAVNAHRNLAAGIALPLQKVGDASMREFIEGCLQIDADQRITLQQALAKLEDIPEGSAKDEMKD
ncbi:hypothetical protein BLNAU_20565 [Blattamonas nauphoetae]|uniref:Protein kinase domain-containing protein n=1 Tax=Blattamonas nauphoetae TaxID=2049346 RepID=A0ABQ9X1L9_9EUKA|nr:hypothetical protein BLNAU_20565 [Blattamonas nauphoetae]